MTTKKVTREHFEKYAKMAESVPDSAVPAAASTKELVLRAFEKDQHLNNIPLHVWDRAVGWIGGHSGSLTPGPWHGLRNTSCSDRVCTLKHIALYRIGGIEPELVEHYSETLEPSRASE